MCRTRTALVRVAPFCHYFLSLLLLVLVGWSVPCDGNPPVYLNQFAVKVRSERDADVAQAVADKHGFRNLGRIGTLNGYYLFEHSHVSKRSLESNSTYHEKLQNEKEIEWFSQQVELKRLKRDFQYPEFKPVQRGAIYRSSGYQRRPYSIRDSYNGNFKDPLYPEQWYLHQGAANGWDMNVKKAWLRGYSGKGVVVSILDDGIQVNHPDLRQNYDPKASYDINGNDEDPMPQDNGDNKHGTRCAGEVAATANNEYCGVGIAFNSSIGGVRMLDGTVNDAVEAKALSLNRNHIDIYSASWGPEDDGKTVDGPGPLAKLAFVEGVTQGRSKKGSIFVWASGNGGRHVDNCNCDGYTNSIYTLSISSATQRGLKPWYLEECSSTLATTYSSGTPGHDKNIVTVDMDASLNPRTMCTRDHTGTSASAPIAAAICALALEANPGLTWRDMQYLVVLTSRAEPLQNEDGWIINGVKRKVNHKFGYGLMDGERMVRLAEQWSAVPPQHICETPLDMYQRMIPKEPGGKLEVFLNTDACENSRNAVIFLEHVQCKISLKFNPRGNLKIILESPLGTRSSLLLPRPKDLYQSDFQDWPFLSVHFWGEKAMGRWKLIIINAGSALVQEPGILMRWSLVLHGTDQEPIHLQSEHSFDPYEFAASSHSEGSLPALQIREDSQNEECHEECLNGCYGTGADKCKSCRHFQTDTEPRLCIKSCSEGQYDDKNNSCHQCHSSCKSCSDSSSTSCQSCFKDHYFIEGHNECKKECPKGFYAHLSQQTCFPCNDVCASCSHQADNCTSCRHGLVAWKSKCLVACVKKMYETAERNCEACHDICETCIGPSYYDCITCPSSSFHLNGTCLTSCPKGFYSDGITNECYNCDPSCSTCNATHCLSCRDGWQLNSRGLCHLKSECNKGQYLFGNECLQCHISCKTCEGPSFENCLSCPSNKFIYRQVCISQCPLNTFVKAKQICSACHETCMNCTGPEAKHCIACKPGLLKQNNLCSTVCGESMFAVDGNCFPCHPTCATCSGKGENDCITCSHNLQLGAGRCQENCPNGFFPNNRTCQPCYHTCQMCKGDGLKDCLSCKNNLYLDDGICMECHQGQYYDPIYQKCQPCDPSCTTCMGPDSNSCTSCTQPLKHDNVNHRCISCCPKNDNRESKDCCNCDELTNTCIIQPITGKRRIKFRDEDEKLQSTGFSYDTFSLVAIATATGTLLILFAAVTCYQTKKHGSGFCWKHDYQRLPMKYETLVDSVEISRDSFWDDEDVRT